MGQIQKEMVPGLEQSLHKGFLKCDQWLPDNVTWGWWKAEGKACRSGLGCRAAAPCPAAPTPKFSNLIGLTEISFQLCLIRRSKTV